MFDNKILMITGGTGSFGRAILEKFINSEIKEIRIFSRDEKKQDEIRKKYQSKKLKFYIGDIRDYDCLVNSMRGVDYLFHAAALKQVPSCEFHPIEAVKTNILGTENVLEAGINTGVKRIVCLSTDKAVYPINAMGISKAMMEKVIVAKSRNAPSGTIISATRYGNVLASRGSVVPLFLEQLETNVPITITNPEMTRFVMTLESAVDLVIYAFENGKNGEIFVQKSPSATIMMIANSLLKIFSKPDHPINIIGTRHGEKQFESLCSKEEMLNVSDEGNYYRIAPDNRDLNYEKYFDEGKVLLNDHEDYNSNNSAKLTDDELKLILCKLDCVKKTKQLFD
jgi:UDP-glucose 4-epimerase